MSGGGATWTIDAGVVTLAKMANLAQDTLIGRSAAGTGVPQTITCTAAGRALLDDITTAAQRTTLGLGSTATPMFAAVTAASLSRAGSVTVEATGANDVNITGGDAVTISAPAEVLIQSDEVSLEAGSEVSIDAGAGTANVNVNAANTTISNNVALGSASGSLLSFYGTVGVPQQTVAVTAADIHAALVALGLFAP